MRLVVQLGVEGGDLAIQEVTRLDGTVGFTVLRDDGTAAALVDELDGLDGLEASETTTHAPRMFDTLTTALDDEPHWPRLLPRTIASAYQAEVAHALGQWLLASLLSADERERVRARWRSVLPSMPPCPLASTLTDEARAATAGHKATEVGFGAGPGYAATKVTPLETPLPIDEALELLEPYRGIYRRAHVRLDDGGRLWFGRDGFESMTRP